MFVLELLVEPLFWKCSCPFPGFFHWQWARTRRRSTRHDSWAEEHYYFLYQSVGGGGRNSRRRERSKSTKRLTKRLSWQLVRARNRTGTNQHESGGIVCCGTPCCWSSIGHVVVGAVSWLPLRRLSRDKVSGSHYHHASSQSSSYLVLVRKQKSLDTTRLLEYLDPVLFVVFNLVKMMKPSIKEKNVNIVCNDTDHDPWCNRCFVGESPRAAMKAQLARREGGSDICDQSETKKIRERYPGPIFWSFPKHHVDTASSTKMVMVSQLVHWFCSKGNRCVLPSSMVPTMLTQSPTAVHFPKIW